MPAENLVTYDSFPLAAEDLGVNARVGKLLVQWLGMGIIGDRHDREVEIAVAQVGGHECGDEHDHSHTGCDNERAAQGDRDHECTDRGQ